MKPWYELTEEDIARLEGDNLSWAIGLALGYEMQPSGTHAGRPLRCIPDDMHGRMCSPWSPSEDVTQALHVLRVAAGDNRVHIILDGRLVLVSIKNDSLLGRDFCEVITRFALRLRIRQWKREQ